MSRKIVNSPTDLSTDVVDKETGEILPPRYTQPKLNKAGMEVPSSITLVAVPAMRDFDLGVRIQRYQRAPQSVQARLDGEYDDDDLDIDDHVDTDDVNPMSQYEHRFTDVQNQLRDKQKERIKKRDAEKAEKLKADKLAFKAQYEALREEGAIPPNETPPNGA